MLFGVFLAFLATCSALECNVGNLILENGFITTKALEQRTCSGKCSRFVIAQGDRSVVFLGCEEKDVVKNIVPECVATKLEERCICSNSYCSDWNAEEHIHVPQVFNFNTTPLCYVGYFANNGTPSPNGDVLNTGVTMNCGLNVACVVINGAVGNTAITTFMCLPQSTCNAAVSTTDGQGGIRGDDDVTMGCCLKADCTSLTKPYPAVLVPPVSRPSDKTIQCKQGMQLNNAPFGQIFTLPCQGLCGSVHFETYIGQGRNRKAMVLEMFTCYIELFCSSIGLSNSCGNLLYDNSTPILRTCCCDSDNCIDPTVLPPIYPNQLGPKCYVGYYANNGTGSPAGDVLNSGATMNCELNTACTSISGAIENTAITAFMCLPQSSCLSAIGTTDGTGTINGDNTQMSCCTKQDCTSIAAPYPAIHVPPVSAASGKTIQCKQGMQLNNMPIGQIVTLPCQGVCSSSHLETYIGQGRNRNTVLLEMFTCYPDQVCSGVGLSNSCGYLLPLPRSSAAFLQGCCCDSDDCIDPTSVPPVYPPGH